MQTPWQGMGGVPPVVMGGHWVGWAARGRQVFRLGRHGSCYSGRALPGWECDGADTVQGGSASGRGAYPGRRVALSCAWGPSWWLCSSGVGCCNTR